MKSGISLTSGLEKGKLIVLEQAISGSLPTGTLMDQHHHRGRMSLLRLRGSDQFKSPIGRCLFGVLHEQAVSFQQIHFCLKFSPNTHRTIQIMKCLNRHEKPLEEAGAWTRVFGTEGPPQEMVQISIHTAQICAEAQVLFDSSEHNDEWKYGLLGIIKEATTIDLLYQIWIDNYSISETWRYQTVYLSPDDALPANGMVQVHHD